MIVYESKVNDTIEAKNDSYVLKILLKFKYKSWVLLENNIFCIFNDLK